MYSVLCKLKLHMWPSNYLSLITSHQKAKSQDYLSLTLHESSHTGSINGVAKGTVLINEPLAHIQDESSSVASYYHNLFSPVAMLHSLQEAL